MTSRHSLVEDTGIVNAPIGSSATDDAIGVLGFIQSATSTLVTLLFFLNYGPLIVKRRWTMWLEFVRLRVLTHKAMTGLKKPKTALLQLVLLGPERMRLFLKVRCGSKHAFVVANDVTPSRGLIC